jgi:A/G-specific adenine glycosylase
MLSSESIDSLLEWGRAARRDLPWRRTRDPWLVLVSEVMLQQTQVDRVVDRYLRFTERWPAPRDLAAEDLATVLREWQGLGYPRRARNLHLAAVQMVARFEGAVPHRYDDLLTLPGIGPYTARAVRVFAYEQHEAVLDTNVGRLLARWNGSSLAAEEAQRAADALVPSSRSWEWGQTLFDFASAVCAKRHPACVECVLADVCPSSELAGTQRDPAVNSAAVSRRQSPFAGSHREARGVVLHVVGARSISARDVAEVAAAELGSDETRVNTALESLVADGLIELVDGQVRLPASRR